MDVEVVLVNPLYEGNVGSVARVMKNFGYSKLALIEPCVLGSFARAMASHAQDVLDSARLTTLEGVLCTSNLVIGTTGIVGSRANLRMPYPLARLGVKLSGMHGIASILFGAEDQGLPNAVLQECDMIVNIETSLEYPVMNISHAAAIVLYSIGSTASATPKRKVASHTDLDRLLQHTSDVLELIDFPTHKRKRVSMTLKRIFSRSELSAAEVRTLRGVLGRIGYRLRR
ncbi:MAG: RNA methyltransferase [Halobacteriota archaeon]